jgi:hypothetical protein
MISKAKSQFRSTGQIMTPRERADSKPDVIDKSRRTLLKAAAVGAASYPIIKVSKKIDDSIKKTSEANKDIVTSAKNIVTSSIVDKISPTKNIEDSSKRAMLKSLMNKSGIKTIKHVGNLTGKVIKTTSGLSTDILHRAIGVH